MERLKVFRRAGDPGDGRFLVTEEGEPFFYLGDTAWELFHRLRREEVDHYLRDRASKCFSVIQAVVLAEFEGLTVPNRYGEVPLIDNDPAKPNDRYFQHVDYVVEKASSLDMFVGMLPTWGDKVNKKWGTGPEIFDPENALAYGEFLGRRYRDGQVIWILGGDRPSETERHREIWRAMAKGLRLGDGGGHLVTYHPAGGASSSQFFHDEAWLDFNMVQSGHSARDLANYKMVERDYALKPVKPCMDGEARYEDHPINWDPKNGWFDDHDVRQAAYWAVFAGAFGHTYGCHDVWQFFEPGRAPVSHARTPWRRALGLPGASQMQHLRRLIESRPVTVRIPDQSILVSDFGETADHAQSTRAADGSYAFVYVPTGRPVGVRLERAFRNRVRASWYDPRNGKAESIGEFSNEARVFSPPSSGQAEDWVLVLDDSTKGFGTPGAS
ncbi:MAG: glycoside hydrolase family 140 protein [Candidatus Brockarchaeota archaeon]|nr:glycoside hydrolase family 140 protein [Candidatus Brockarchaeota archaeon]